MKKSLVESPHALMLRLAKKGCGALTCKKLCLTLGILAFTPGVFGKGHVEIELEGVYPGHLQDIWMSSNAIWWAHTQYLVKTDRKGRILQKREVGGHHAGLEVKDGRLYTAVCAFNGEPRGKTTPQCHVMVGEYDADTLNRIDMHVLDINDRAGSFCFLEDGSFLVGCLRHPSLKPSEVKFHHIGKDYKLIKTHIVDLGCSVKLGIEVIRRYGDDIYLFIYGSPVIKLDAKTFAVVGRYKGWGGELGFSKEGDGAWVGVSVRDRDKKERSCRSKLVLKPFVWAESVSANLAVDDEFVSDGLGGFRSWASGGEVVERAVVRSLKTGPNGSNTLLLKGFHENGGFFHTGCFRLVTGEPYRISVWTRTKGLPTGGVRLVLWGEGWKGPELFASFPTNTNGRWTKIEATCSVLPAVETCGFGVHFKTDMPSDATIEIAQPRVESLSENGRKGSKAPVLYQACHFRVVPVIPKLSEVDPDSGEMTFYYGGDLPGEFGDFEVRASVDGVFRGSAPLGSTRRASVRMGRLLPGDHSLTVNLVERKTNRRLSRDVYQIRARAPAVFNVGKPLNNLVTELVSTRAVEGEVPFVNPRDGWVFIGLTDVDAMAEGFLDGDEVPVLCKRDGEPFQTMRYLLAGRHVLTLRGVNGGVLAVRAVKSLVCRRNDSLATDIRTHQYGEAFCRRFVFPWSNTVGGWQDSGTPNRFDPANDESVLSFAERGMRVAGRASLTSGDLRRGDVDEIIKAIRQERRGWVSGRDIFFDENRMLGPHGHHENFAEALWRSFAAGQAFYVYYADGGQYPFLEPRVHANEISAVINSGNGRGCLALEAYPRGFTDERQSYAQIDGYLAFAKSIEAIVPAAKNCIDYNFSYWMQPSHGYNTWASAAADMRVLTDYALRRVAADPAFKDTAWGVGFGAFYTTDEEMVRWMMHLVRHYAIEGRTDSVSESLGYKYNPGYVRNGDFESGLDGWTVDAAASGSLTRIVLDGYGRWSQGRRAMTGDRVGDALALFVRHPNRANRLSQKISGLVPGKRYSLVYISQDYDQYLKTPGAQGEDYAFRVDFDGAMNEPTLETCCIGKNRKSCHVCRHRLVFRAQSPEVTVTFLDRSSCEPESVTTHIGQRRMVNFFHMHDYFEGDRQDVNDMLKLK